MAKKFIEGQLGMFRPDSDWVRPTELPDLRQQPIMAMDLELYDHGLSTNLGPGWAFGADNYGGKQKGGYLCGISWAAEGSSGYAPVCHPDSDCFPPENVLRWANDHLRSNIRVVFHNSNYDLGWLGAYDIKPPDNLEDTLPAAVMLDESRRSYSLDACCEREGIEGKDIELLREAVRSYGGKGVRPAAELYVVPARYAGPYATQDAVATLGLWRQLEPKLWANALWEPYRTEIELIPMVVAMKRRGIRLDLFRIIRTKEEFYRRRDVALAQLSDRMKMGRQVTINDVRSPQWCSRVFAAENLTPPRTAPSKRFPTGQESFSSDWMEGHEHWLPRLVTEAKKYEDAADKHIGTFLQNFSRNDRIHPEIHQFLSEEGGTRSHRFSYSDPPLQQMYSPDKDPRSDLPDEPGKAPGWGKGKGPVDPQRAIGTLIRDCFLPEEGEFWAALDYGSQEPRITVHFAAKAHCRGADEAVARYLENPRLDYHAMVAEMVGRPRPIAKILNLAMTYGKGKNSLAEELGVSVEEAEEILRDYHERLPFIKSLEDECRRRAASRGYIRLIDGARMHYNDWEAGWLDYDVRRDAIQRGLPLGPCSREEAIRRQADPDHPWSRSKLRRADTRKALNNLVQGSAARQTKRAMLALWREGVLPLIQMHDEVGISAATQQQVIRAEQIMIETTPLLVPVVVDAEIGRSWGTAKHSWAEALAKYGPEIYSTRRY